MSLFDKWNSALLKFFIGYSKINGLPTSMCEWKEDNNELSDWILSMVEFTDKLEDFISLNDLKEDYKKYYGVRALNDRDFICLAKALFRSKGYEITDKYQFRIEGKNKTIRNVIKGVNIF